jgi:copper(I)-binding protein
VTISIVCISISDELVGYHEQDDNHIATATPAGKVDLTRASAVRKAEGPDTNVYYFLVNTSGGQEDNLLMGAETEATRAEWLQAIQMWIDHFRQPKTPPASPLPKSPKMRY